MYLVPKLPALRPSAYIRMGVDVHAVVERNAGRLDYPVDDESERVGVQVRIYSYRVLIAL